MTTAEPVTDRSRLTDVVRAIGAGIVRSVKVGSRPVPVIMQVGGGAGLIEGTYLAWGTAPAVFVASTILIIVGTLIEGGKV